MEQVFGIFSCLIIASSFIHFPPAGGAFSEEAAGQEKPASKPRPAKELCRTDYDKMLAGVCGGLGEYFNIDSTIVRLIFVISSFYYLIGVIAYIVLAILLPIKLSPEEER
ncbi:MAG: PspC domain-containing protein [Candidatus Hinthialibacter sp.]